MNLLEVKDLIDWHNWLSTHYNTEAEVWLVYHRSDNGKPGVDYESSVEEALCFGWVDSKAVKRDAESCYLKFTPRNPKSKWGKRNKERALKMQEKGLMTPFGQALIDTAIKTGKWTGEG